MTAPRAASIVDLVLGSELGASDKAAGNRCSLEGVTLESKQDGLTEIRIRKFEAAALRLASGALVLEFGRIAVHGLVGQLRTEAGVPRLSAIGAVEAEFSGVKLHGPLTVPRRGKERRHHLPIPLRAGRQPTRGASARSVRPTARYAGRSPTPTCCSTPR
jgi:hypothetical protein